MCSNGAEEEEAFMDGAGTALERLLSVQDAAERLNVRVSWVYAKVAARELPFVKVGRYVRFRPADLAAYVTAARESERERITPQAQRARLRRKVTA
jgi:excisionase family DNA binding protein